MNNAVNILSMQTKALTSGVKNLKQNTDSMISFLSLLQSNAALSGSSDNSVNNAPASGTKTTVPAANDTNGANVKPADGGGSTLLAKVLNGKPEDISDFDGVEWISGFKEIIITVEETEKVNMSKMLEILGVPLELIPELIAAVMGTQIPDETVKGTFMGQSAGNFGILTDNTELLSESLIVGTAEAVSFISEIAEYIYSGETEELTARADGELEQVWENIADFAGIMEETGDFKNAAADYTIQKLEASGTQQAAGFNAETLKEAIIQTLNEEPPELEVLPAEKESEADAQKPAPTLFDIANSMKRTVNFAQVNLTAADTKTDTVQIIRNVPVFENVLNAEHGIEEKITAVDIPIIQTAEAEEIKIIDPALITAAGTEVLSEVSIENFSEDISRLIAERAQTILINTAKIGMNAETFELRLRLHPAELGEVFLKLTFKNGSLGLNITASGTAAQSAILNQMNELREVLSAQDIDLANFDVNTFGHNSRDSAASGNRQNNSGIKEENGAAETERTAAREEAERRENAMNYIRSRRILYKTV
ncbi:MAG: flagellar hook-length control protein FliK [Oscillospiraceae bacterium]|nr:flagellar hook-length control protein FliK [Oscillospiraceae bacterium]